MGAADDTLTLELAAVTQLPENTNCLACSEDGSYLSLGHSGGLSVWCASTLVSVAEWLQDKLEITSIQMTKAAESTYLLGTVDDMGVARVFAYHNDVIYLLSAINALEDINNRSICVTFELSEGGQYGAASVCCSGASWLEVHRLPLAAWLKELEVVQSQRQDPKSPGDVDVKWSSVSLIIKIKPPKSPTGKPVDGQANVSQTSDFLTHCLTLDVIRSSSCGWEKPFLNLEPEKRKEQKIPRRCTHHFLLPCNQFTGDSTADLHTAFPVAVAVWWNGSRNLVQYLLQNAPKNKTDVEPVPDVLWPNASEILCSAVSGGTRYVALGLSDASVCVWDRLSGAPLAVVSGPASDSPFFRVQFVQYWPVTADDSQIFTAEKVSLAMLCKSGILHSVTAGRGTQSCPLQLSERPKDSSDVPTIITSVPFMQSLSLVVQMNGKMFLHDVIKNKTVCFLTPPSTHLITTPCSPVYALNSKRQTLFIRGDRDTGGSASSDEGRQSRLFSCSFGESEVFKRYMGPLLNSPQQRAALTHATVEETCHLYLQERALSADDRNKSITRSWQQLQETVMMLQQRRPSVSQPRSCKK